MSQYFNLQRFGSSAMRGSAKPEDSRVNNNNENPPSLGQTTVSTVLYPVDGRKGWLIVLGSFLAHLAVLGNLYAFGIFVIPLSQEFAVSRADVSLIGTINIAFFYLAGIFSGPLADKFGVRPIVFIGICVWMLGCFLASITSAVWQQILTQGIMVGLGSSFVYWPAIAVVPQWFDKHRATAVGFAALGAGLGNMIFALGGQAIITSLGWRNTLRVIGGVGGFILFIALYLLERRVPPRKTGGLFDVAKTLIKLKSYKWFLFGTFLFQWGFFVPFVHLAAYSRDLGIESTLQGLAVGMLGIGSSVGRVAIGPIADKAGRMNTFRACMFLAAVSMAVWPACTEISTILVFAFFYAFFAGGFIAQSPVVAGDLWGVNSLGGTFALINLVMIPGGLACGPIAGLIFETYGTYWPAIWGAAAFLFGAALCLVMVRKDPLPAVTTPVASHHPTLDHTSPTQIDSTNATQGAASFTSIDVEKSGPNSENPQYEQASRV